MLMYSEISFFKKNLSKKVFSSLNSNYKEQL